MRPEDYIPYLPEVLEVREEDAFTILHHTVPAANALQRKNRRRLLRKWRDEGRHASWFKWLIVLYHDTHNGDYSVPTKEQLR